MKTNLLFRMLPGGTKVFLALSAVLLLYATPAARGAGADWLLEKGIYAEETKGDLKEAARIYQQIVDDPQTDRGLVAQAQLRRGLCELKLGNKPQAISILEQLTQQFPDKDKLLALVEQHMPQLLDEMLKHIEQNYIQEVDRGELLETALRAIVGKLDAQSLLRPNDMEFLNTHDLAEMNVQVEQKLAGIGVVLSAKDGNVFVQQAPFPGSPALLGGILAGDCIVTIDGNEVPRNNLKRTIELLRGPVGTPITLGVKRAGSEQLRKIKLVRNTIRLETVQGNRRKPDNTWEFMLDDTNKIGYLRLTYVGKQSAEEMQEALDGLSARGMKALVLDLRNNPGGMLDGSVAISDLFVERGRIVTVKGRASETVYDAKLAGTFSGFPMAVLVNAKTASAAEIVAACLQDHRRAAIIGERTFGQGIVRSLFQLKNGAGALKLPVAAYYRPDGRNMNRYPDARESDDWGVSPDEGFVVASEEEGLPKALDYLRTQLGKTE
jgi:carboxyl-terminal processing protease